MTTARKIGIWMNHSVAYLMEFTTDLITTVIIKSQINDYIDEGSVATTEAQLLFKEQKVQSAYFKRLKESVQNCREVILFGPTYAKVKLYNHLRADKNFSETKIGIIKTEDMDENQLQDFISKYLLAK